jgi:hypothetical protein
MGALAPASPVSADALRALATRPDLWTTAARAARDLAPRGWWRRAPFLPLPDRRWLAFRTVTAYGGDGSAPLAGSDLVTWLEWRKEWPG